MIKYVISAALFCVALSFSTAQKRDVSFESGDLTLKGTLYSPKGKGPFPAVVFVHGSGPEVRKNSKFSARWLASIGYVALTYDKRGAGESDGEDSEWRRFSFETLASDVVAAVEFLSQREEVDAARIGLHATSQGGWVAPLAAAKTDLVSFMVIKSASVCSVGEDRVFERAERLKGEGFSATDLAEVREMQLVEGKTTEDDDTPDQFSRLFEQYKAKAWFPRVYGGRDPFAPSLVSYRRWYATIVDFNSIPILQQLDIPIFWIFGDPNLDKLGPVEQSMAAVSQLKASGKSYQLQSYAGQGHNVSERSYEKELYDWLIKINGDEGFKFRKH